MQSLELFFNTEVVPLWPAINTTLLQFYLYAISPNFQVCFAVELTGCLSSNGKCISSYVLTLVYK